MFNIFNRTEVICSLLGFAGCATFMNWLVKVVLVHLDLMSPVIWQMEVLVWIICFLVIAFFVSLSFTLTVAGHKMIWPNPPKEIVDFKIRGLVSGNDIVDANRPLYITTITVDLLVWCRYGESYSAYWELIIKDGKKLYGSIERSHNNPVMVNNMEVFSSGSSLVAPEKIVPTPKSGTVTFICEIPEKQIHNGQVEMVLKLTTTKGNEYKKSVKVADL